MAKRPHTLRRVLLIIAGVIVVLTAALEIVLGSRFFTNKVTGILQNSVDATVSSSRIRVSALRAFPALSVSADDLLVTYPHERFADYDSLSVTRFHEAGRGEEADTLAAFDRLYVTANPWRLIGGRIHVGKVFLDGVRLYAHSYADSVANWNVFKPSDKQKDTLGKKETKLPWIVLKKFRFNADRVCYTDLKNNIAADLSLGQLSARGKLKINPDDFLVLGAGAEIESLMADYLLNGKEFPLRLDGSALFERSGKSNDITIPGIDLEAATIPLHLDGQARMFNDSIPLKANVYVHDFNADTFVSDYAPYLASVAGDFRSDALINVDATADGVFSNTQRPDVDVAVSIPRGRILYKPMGIAGKLKIDATADDLLGEDPAFTLNSLINARLDSVRTHIAEDKIHPYGNLDVKLDADFRLSELSKLNFYKASVNGSVTGDLVGMNMPGDSIRTAIFHPGIEISSGPEGLDLVVAADSILFRKGVGLLAKAREMRNVGRLFKEDWMGESTPTMLVESEGGGLFLRADANRVGIKGYKLGAKARKNMQADEHPNRPAPDPDRKLPLFLSEKAFEAGDINIALDSTKADLLSRWNPTANASFGSGFVASPAIPLKTRIGGFSFVFDGDRVKLDSINVTSGVSDVTVKGHVSGLKRALRRKGLISTDIKIHSKHFNLNEIVSALDMGKDIPRDTTLTEDDESFVVDSIANAEFVDIPMPLVIVPANLSAKLDLDVDRFDVMDFVIKPGYVRAQMKERTVQISDARFDTNIGVVDMDAYYSTITKQNINAGADVAVTQMTVPNILKLLPSVTDHVPALRSFEGNLDCSVSATTQLDTNMNVIIPTLDGVVNINGTNLNISDAGDLRKITRLLLFKNKNIGHIDDLHLNVVVHDSKMEIFPFELGVDRYHLALQGMQGLDKSMYYHVSVLKSPFLIPFGVDIYGYLDNWRFSLARAKFRNGKVPAFTEELGSMKINISTGIKNIFNRSVKEISDYNRRTRTEIERQEKEIGYSPDTHAEALSAKEFASIDSLSFANEILEDDLALAAEVDSVLEDSYKETSKLLEEYTATFYDDKMLRRMERMRKKEERKKK